MAEVPESAIEEKFLAATGPGGQNVNKVATACQLRVDVFTLVLTARRYRTQEQNRADARARLAGLLAQAEEREARRVKTKPSKSAKAKRVDTKKGRSVVKAGRGRVSMD